MSKIVLFYKVNDNVKSTVVHGQAFLFVSHIINNFNEDQACAFIDEGAKNNGYHFNSVTDEYEFWAAGKNSDDILDFNNITQLKNNYDAVFKVDSEKILVQVN